MEKTVNVICGRTRALANPNTARNGGFDDLLVNDVELGSTCAPTQNKRGGTNVTAQAKFCRSRNTEETTLHDTLPFERLDP